MGAILKRIASLRSGNDGVGRFRIGQQGGCSRSSMTVLSLVEFVCSTSELPEEATLLAI